MQCKICQNSVKFFAKASIMVQNFEANYYLCEQCEYVFVDNPHWLPIAYEEGITDSDIGLVNRNTRFSVITFALIRLFLNYKSKFLDFAGGYGLFVRLMRDLGIDYYWQDKYTKNLFAKSFHAREKFNTYELVTAFEVLEHLENPIPEIEEILKYSNHFLFSTELLPKHKPLPHEWNYYALEHGQHIGFFSLKTLKFMAKKYNYNFYTNGVDLHFFTKRKISNFFFKLITKYYIALFIRYAFRLKSLQTNDEGIVKNKICV
ncbi:class I SAM-dependent methyltransferase [Silvanigrella aquatica]|uniref:Methyltransferase type 11 n=1 Tax=Silvanigrella aquatica TaxID=1915309 RepID=A0A1L4D0T4_9BACT|nr:class I SAM-dependent methyltransferase [Silvanigrella aquatica]APJ03815.1 hypothetical protein AXG55_07815 [Silvanigrella aquatica]